MAESAQVIGGLPQLIRRIDLANEAEHGIKDISIPELLDRVIIGPSQYGYSISESLSKILSETGVQNVDKKVFFSDIPIRT